MSNKMWGGRFTERPDAIMEEINVSIDVDRHLYAQDIAASKAHAAMLAAQGIITANDAKNIARGLDTILSEIGKGSFDFKRALEDIHMNVESRLGELIGPVAGRLHTARSRHDQVATAFRLYVRATIDAVDAALAAFPHALAERALQPAGPRLPGFPLPVGPDWVCVRLWGSSSRCPAPTNDRSSAVVRVHSRRHERKDFPPSRARANAERGA